MEYVRTMTEALALAIENRCVVWADQEGTIFDVEAMLTFLEIEKKLELPPDHYIAVSIEGAIGIADRYEFDIEWLFYPVLDEKVRQKYLDEFNRRVKRRPRQSRLSAQSSRLLLLLRQSALAGRKILLLLRS